jgi:hypothetical protein
MAVPKHLEEAAARLKRAAAKIDDARSKPLTLESLRQWIEAVTDYSMALADIQSFNNESVHEKLHELAGRVGHEKFGAAGRHRG